MGEQQRRVLIIACILNIVKIVSKNLFTMKGWHEQTIEPTWLKSLTEGYRIDKSL